MKSPITETDRLRYGREMLTTLKANLKRAVRRKAPPAKIKQIEQGVAALTQEINRRRSNLTTP